MPTSKRLFFLSDHKIISARLALNYDQGSTLAPFQYNGNISQATWQVKDESVQQYGFAYDYLDRLTKATSNVSNRYGTDYTYDARGNITTLKRNGLRPDATFGQIDNLLYGGYATSKTNQFQTIVDNAPAAAKVKGFKPGTGGTYLYDKNGNLTNDPHKEIIIQYNYLNLPSSILRTNTGNTITWKYDGTGKKLQKVVATPNPSTLIKNENPIVSGTYKEDIIQSAGNIPASNTVIFKGRQEIRLENGFTNNGDFTAIITGDAAYTQDYFDNIEYKDGKLEAIYHGSGRLFLQPSLDRYQYAIRDHLGNTRILFAKSDTIGLSNKVTILQASHYYPFGMQMEGEDVREEDNHDYLFNGNELQSELGLNTYDFNNRMYDPAVGRFWQIDKLADDPMQVDKSPFAYGWNNPVTLNDPDGNCPRCLKALGKTAVKSIAKGKLDLGEIYDVVESVATLADGQLNMADAEAVFNLLSPVSTKELRAAKNFVEGAGDAKKVANKVDNVKDASKLNKVDNVGDGGSKADYIVTSDGVTIKNTDKYKIPDNYIENPYGRSGKFKEKLRIDPATPAGKKGPNHSHYHLDGKGTHYSPNPKDKKDPGFSGNN